MEIKWPKFRIMNQKNALLLKHTLTLLVLFFTFQVSSVLGNDDLRPYTQKLENSKDIGKTKIILLQMSNKYGLLYPDSIIYYYEKHQDKISLESEIDLKITNNAASSYYKKGSLDKAGEFYAKIVEAAKGKGGVYEPIYLKSFQNTGLVLQAKGESDKAEAIYMQTLKECSNEYDSIKMSVMLNLYLIAYYKGDLEKAGEWADKTIAIGEKIDQPATLGKAYNFAAVVFAQQGDYVRAKPYYIKAYRLANLTENFESASTSSQNLGTCYKELEQFDSAVHYLSLSYELHKKYYKLTTPLI